MAEQLFSITALDHPDSTGKRAQLRPDHLRRVDDVGDALMMGGPLRDADNGPAHG